MARIALRVALKSGFVPGLGEEALLALARNKLSEAVAAITESGEGRTYRRIPGMELIGSGTETALGFQMGGSWKALLNGKTRFMGGTWADQEIGAARLLEGLDVSPADRRVLTDGLLPTVVQEDGGYVLKNMGVDGDVEDLYVGKDGHPEKFRLSEIVTKRKLTWGSYPVYEKEELACCLEAVLLSRMPQAEKDQFVDDLLRTEAYDEDVPHDRPAYAGGSYTRHEVGTRIRLPTGQALKLVQGRRFTVDSPSQLYSEDLSDAVFVMALVERGRLPAAALDGLYSVDRRADGLVLRTEYPISKRISLDLSRPFDKQIDFPPLYLAFLLSRDPRIDEATRNRLRRYFGANVGMRVVSG